MLLHISPARLLRVLISVILAASLFSSCSPPEFEKSCTDGIKNNSETEVDCGGYCPECGTCSDGKRNQGETEIDCGGPCAACPTCTDGLKNGQETGVDCGGPDCLTCPPTCTDGIKNGNETGIDCGGSCPACPTCFDGKKNGTETGIDCGGSCPPCISCTDGIQNGTETGIDCGGSCPPCPSCNDNLKNGDETSIDCGGSCIPCVSNPCALPTSKFRIQHAGQSAVSVQMGTYSGQVSPQISNVFSASAVHNNKTYKLYLYNSGFTLPVPSYLSYRFPLYGSSGKPGNNYWAILQVDGDYYFATDNSAFLNFRYNGSKAYVSTCGLEFKSSSLKDTIIFGFDYQY